MGRTKEFTIAKPTAKATKGQTYALYCAVGIDVQEVKGLTQKKAHDLLNDANNGKAYHVRQTCIDMGGRVAKQDVAKEHRSDPKPKKKTSKKSAKAEPELADLLAILKKRPELIKSLLTVNQDELDGLAVEDDDEEEEAEEEEVVEPPKPKKTRAAKPKKKGTKINAKNGARVTVNDDDTISDEDLLAMLANGTKKALRAS